jgi:dihydroorotase
MNVLIKSATIIDSSSKLNGQTVDILIENARISRIASAIENTNNYPIVSLENLHVSPGWFDSSVSFGEPGFEERETLSNGLKTAALSGFTAVAVNANTHPVIDSKADINFLIQKSQNQPVTLLPIGALTKNSNGTDLAEMFDMRNAGALAFYDYQKPVANPNLFKIALQYADTFGGLVCDFPQESKIAGSGVVNEHITSTNLGLKGIPALAESLQITRNLHILEYTGGKLHIPTVSTSEAVTLIRKAKEKGLDVSCSVAIHHLLLTDELLNDFNTNYKVLPPLRTKTDTAALIEALKDGTIDMVCTDHNPIDIEHKNVEFDHAMFGSIGLESAFGALNKVFSTEQTVSLLTKGKSRFGMRTSSVNEGEIADLSLFNPDKSYTFTENTIRSTSKNSCFLNDTLKGEAYGIYANGYLLIK